MCDKSAGTGRAIRILLTVIVVLLAIIALELWHVSPNMMPAAQAQIPDSGLQRNKMLDESRQTNALLSDILEHLRTKAVKVEMQRTDKKPSRGEGRAKP